MKLCAIKQVQSLGLEIKKDISFNERLITLLYALEVQYLVENNSEDEFSEIQEAYDIPDNRAAEIVDETCKKYISQLLNLALRSAKRYEETECIRWTKEILKYAKFISGKVDADGNLFTESDKKRLISFYQAELEEKANSKSDADSDASEIGADELAKLKDMIRLTEDFVPPVQGIEGLLGNVASLSSLTQESEKSTGGKKKWSWG